MRGEEDEEGGGWRRWGGWGMRRVPCGERGEGTRGGQQHPAPSPGYSPGPHCESMYLTPEDARAQTEQAGVTII